MAEPKKNVAYEFYVSLVDSADPTKFKANPTIVTGDFKVSTGGGAFADLATLPVVTPAGSKSVKVNLSAAEMNADKVVLQVEDQAGAEWDPVAVFIDVPEASVDDLAKVEKILRNRTYVDPDTGIMTVFEDDGTTPLFTCPVFEDIAGDKPYSGTSAKIDRRDRLA